MKVEIYGPQNQKEPVHSDVYQTTKESIGRRQLKDTEKTYSNKHLSVLPDIITPTNNRAILNVSQPLNVYTRRRGKHEGL